MTLAHPVSAHNSDTASSADAVLSPRAAYNLAASYYDQWKWQKFWRRNEAPIIQRVLSGKRRAERGLDIGTGTGFYARKLTVACKETYGVDISERMLAIASRKSKRKASFCQADAQYLPFPDGSFDIAIAARVLSHIDRPYVFFREIARVCQINSTLILSDVDPRHDYRYTSLPVKDGQVFTSTFKHRFDDINVIGQSVGFQLVDFWNIGASNLRWTPPDGSFSTLPGRDPEHIGYIMLWQKET